MMVDCLVVLWAVLWVVLSVVEMPSVRHIIQQHYQRNKSESSVKSFFHVHSHEKKKQDTGDITG